MITFIDVESIRRIKIIRDYEYLPNENDMIRLNNTTYKVVKRRFVYAYNKDFERDFLFDIEIYLKEISYEESIEYIQKSL